MNTLQLAALTAIAAAAPSAIASAQDVVTVSIEGTVSSVSVPATSGAFAGAQAGDAWTFSCQVFLDQPSTSGDTLLYNPDFSNVSVTSTGGTEGPALFPGSTLGLGNIGVTSTLNVESFTSALALESDVTFLTASTNLSATGVLPTSDLSVLAGVYEAEDFTFNQASVSGETIEIALEIDTITVGTPITVGVLGSSYCAANENSTGFRGAMSASGRSDAASNDLTLTASSLPPLSFGFFIASQSQGFVANPAGSAGNLCVSGAIGRFVGPGQIQQSNVTGSFSLAVDMTVMPTPVGSVAVQQGETWHFQAWHRDVLNGAATSNFTDGLSIDFD